MENESPKHYGSAERVQELELQLPAVAELRRTSTGPWIRIALQSNRGSVTRLPVELREAFETYLQGIVERARISTTEASDERPTTDRAGNNPVRKLLGRVCGTCRGRCCREAGDKNAYLGPESILVYRARNPAATTREIVDDYLSRIPEESYEGSCVFHGRSGCALPGQMRSETCNWFLCDALIELSRRAALEDRATVLALAMRDNNPVRLVVFDAAGVLYERTIQGDR